MDGVRPGWKHRDEDDHSTVHVVSSHQQSVREGGDRPAKTERSGKPWETAGVGGKDSENKRELGTRSAGAQGWLCVGCQAPRNGGGEQGSKRRYTPTQVPHSKKWQLTGQPPVTKSQAEFLLLSKSIAMAPGRRPGEELSTFWLGFASLQRQPPPRTSPVSVWKWTDPLTTRHHPPKLPLDLDCPARNQRWFYFSTCLTRPN